MCLDKLVCRYGEALLEILIAGGLLAPGGSIQQDGDKGTVSTRWGGGVEYHGGVDGVYGAV